MPFSVLPVGGYEDSTGAVLDNFVKGLVNFFKGGVYPQKRLGGGGPVLLECVLFLGPVAGESGVGRASKGVDGGRALGKELDDGIADLINNAVGGGAPIWVLGVPGHRGVVGGLGTVGLTEVWETRAGISSYLGLTPVACPLANSNEPASAS